MLRAETLRRGAEFRGHTSNAVGRLVLPLLVGDVRFAPVL
jgi:hypothetical protein